MMKRLFTFALILTGLFAAVSCGNGDKGKEQIDPLYGYWSDAYNNYHLILDGDSIFYFLDEMDGFEFQTSYQKKDKNTLIFDIPEGSKGSLTLDPETQDLTLVVDLGYGEGPQTFNIPAHDHFDLATTKSHIASTYLFEEDLTTVADTLRNISYLPLVDSKEDYAVLLLPDGRKGYVKGDKVVLMRSRPTPYFFEQYYSQECKNLQGHPESLETYSFNKLANGKIGVMFNRMNYDGAPAQDLYFVGDLEGIYINVTHAFNDYTEWEEGKMEETTPLDKPFKLTLVEAMDTPYIRIGERVFQQSEQKY